MTQNGANAWWARGPMPGLSGVDLRSPPSASASIKSRSSFAPTYSPRPSFPASSSACFSGAHRFPADEAAVGWLRRKGAVARLRGAFPSATKLTLKSQLEGGKAHTFEVHILLIPQRAGVHPRAIARGRRQRSAASLALEPNKRPSTL